MSDFPMAPPPGDSNPPPPGGSPPPPPAAKSSSRDADGESKSESKSGESKTGPWIPPGKVSDQAVHKAFLRSLLRGAEERESRNRDRERLDSFLLFMGLAAAIVGVVVCLSVTLYLGTIAGFVCWVLLGIVAARGILTWVLARASKPQRTLRVTATEAFTSPGGGMLAAALEFVEDERDAGVEWAVDWFSRFRRTWGNVDPLDEIPGTFVDELEARSEGKAPGNAQAVVPAFQWPSLRIPSVFAILPVLWRLLMLAVAFGILGYLFLVWTGHVSYEDTLGKYMHFSGSPTQKAQDEARKMELRLPEIYPNTPQGASGPSDDLREHGMFPGSAPYQSVNPGH